MSRRNRAALGCGFAIAVAAGALGGCEEYLDRSDTVSYGIGDSVAINRTTQTIERWPNAARYDRWTTDGERARLSIEKFRERKIKIEKPEQNVVGAAQTRE